MTCVIRQLYIWPAFLHNCCDSHQTSRRRLVQCIFFCQRPVRGWRSEDFTFKREKIRHGVNHTSEKNILVKIDRYDGKKKGKQCWVENGWSSALTSVHMCLTFCTITDGVFVKRFPCLSNAFGWGDMTGLGVHFAVMQTN